MNALVPVIAIILGLILWLAGSGKVSEAGRILYAAGTLAFLIGFGRTVVELFPK